MTKRVEEPMTNLVRNAAAVVGALGLAVSVAPAASAAAQAAPKAGAAPVQHLHVHIHNFNVGDGDVQFASEFGPGNLANSLIKESEKARVAAQNEAIRTGDIEQSVHGKGNRAPFEIEGSEQDQGEA
jgi:hypothetical protein